MTIRFHRNDLPDLSSYRVAAVAIDTETLGLNPHRDRLCVVQISPGDGTADIIQIAPGQRAAANLGSLLADPAITKIFHYARFDVGGAGTRLRRHAAAGVLHQDRVAAHPHLYRSPRAEGHLRGAPRNKPVEGAAVVRLGSRTAVPRAARICRVRRAPSASAASEVLEARLSAGEPRTRGRSLLPLPADPRPPRPDGLERGGYFFARLTGSARPRGRDDVPAVLRS